MGLEADDLAACLRAELPHALRGGQVIGYFQPEVELSTGRLVAAELLARWEHPEFGVLSPTLFIPLVEDLGLMGEFSRVMLRQAIAQHRAWAASGWIVPVSVNIGPGCVADPGFPAFVVQLLREEQVAGQMLTLEVSEGIGTAAAGKTFIAQLAGSGVRISLDDFGTGFASLESLGGWPIDELKLDRSIVQRIATSASFHVIISTTIDLAHQLGVRVVAEGIENKVVSSELRALGCDIGQGFFLGRPMQAAAFTEWMRDPTRHAPRLSASSKSPAGMTADQAGPWRLASTTANRTARAVRCVAQPVGGGALAFAVTMIAAYGLWQLFRWGGREHQALIGGLAFIPVDAAVPLMAWRASLRSDLGRETCRAWRLLTAAFLLYLATDLLELAYQVGRLHRRGYPTWADAAFLGFYPIVLWGLLSFPSRRRAGPERLRLVLDAGTVFIGGAMLIWYVALSPTMAAANGRFDLVNLIYYAYPVGDLLLLFGTLAVLLRGPPQSSVLALRIFAVGMLAFIAADVAYAHISAFSTYVDGGPVDTLEMAALLIVYLAAACQLRTKSAGVIEPLPKPVPPPSFLPYLAIAFSSLLLAVIGLHSVRFNYLGGLLLGAAGLAFAVGARQYLAQRDYGRLAVRYRELAEVDGTTGLYNRRHFMEAAEAAVARAQLGQPLVALLIDVDKFKQINDTHGHVAGDQVLAEMARACREQVRPGDIAGRYGGDEFIIIIVGITSLRAAQIADELARPAARGLSRDGTPIICSASIGIAEAQPGWDLPILLTHADQAMYEAKRAGGGGWRIFKDTTAANP
jgi:diguanylate cyclase (GGDEF)-like protein